MAADRFVFAEDTARFTTSRAFLRLILAGYLQVDPGDISLGKGDHGKPRLEAGPGRAPWQFNVSHSGSYGLVAVALGREVGVDIEWTGRGTEYLDLARRVCTPGEIRQLERLPAAGLAQAFFACWTRKEAVVKAVGSGFSCPLKSFEVSLLPGQPAALVRGENLRWADGGNLADLTLMHIDPSPDYVGALAVRGSGWVLRQWAAEGLLP
jgi:4'-phosphopantetheinyl transferase